MPTSAKHRPSCSRCAGAVKRVHRQANELRLGAGTGMRRYACMAEGCGWQGLLPRHGRLRTRNRHRALKARRLGWMVPLVLLALVGAGVAAVTVKALRVDSAAPFAPAGESHYGRPLPAAHPLQVKFVEQLAAAPAVGQVAEGDAPQAELPALTLRRQCSWGRPGGNPYKGTVEQALQAAGLPPEVVQAIALQVKSGQAVDRLDIQNGSIRAQGSGRWFDPQNIAMTYGMTLCLGTRVNFVHNHIEKATLYEAADAQGQMVAVMIPDVCGNVSVLGQLTNGRKKQTASGTPDDIRWMPAQLDWDPKHASSGAGGRHTVPEPQTLFLVAFALALLAWQRRPGGAATSGPERP